MHTQCSCCFASTSRKARPGSTYTLSMAEMSSASAAGDSAMLGSAFFYSLATVRLSGWAAQSDALPLATAKSTCLACCSLAWLLGYGLLHQAWTAGAPSLPCRQCGNLIALPFYHTMLHLDMFH